MKGFFGSKVGKMIAIVAGILVLLILIVALKSCGDSKSNQKEAGSKQKAGLIVADPDDEDGDSVDMTEFAEDQKPADDKKDDDKKDDSKNSNEAGLKVDAPKADSKDNNKDNNKDSSKDSSKDNSKEDKTDDTKDNKKDDSTEQWGPFF